MSVRICVPATGSLYTPLRSDDEPLPRLLLDGIFGPANCNRHGRRVRGAACVNNLVTPMKLLDDAVLACIEPYLTPDVIADAVAAAVKRAGSRSAVAAERARLDQLKTVEAELARLVAFIRARHGVGNARTGARRDRRETPRPAAGPRPARSSRRLPRVCCRSRAEARDNPRRLDGYHAETGGPAAAAPAEARAGPADGDAACGRQAQVGGLGR
jgi:hypothetical protein